MNSFLYAWTLQFSAVKKFLFRLFEGLYNRFKMEKLLIRWTNLHKWINVWFQDRHIPLAYAGVRAQSVEEKIAFSLKISFPYRLQRVITVELIRLPQPLPDWRSSNSWWKTLHAVNLYQFHGAVLGRSPRKAKLTHNFYAGIWKPVLPVCERKRFPFLYSPIPT